MLVEKGCCETEGRGGGGGGVGHCDSSVLQVQYISLYKTLSFEWWKNGSKNLNLDQGQITLKGQEGKGKARGRKKEVRPLLLGNAFSRTRAGKALSGK